MASQSSTSKMAELNHIKLFWRVVKLNRAKWQNVNEIKVVLKQSCNEILFIGISILRIRFLTDAFNLKI